MEEGFPRPVVRPPAYATKRSVWVVSEEPATEGLAILVPAGIPIAEMRQYREQWDEIAALINGDRAKGKRKGGEADADRPDPNGLMLRLIAPYVLDWTATATDADSGEAVPVPPPAESGEDALRALSVADLDWIVRRISNGLYLGNGFGKTWRDASGDTPPTS